MKIEPIEVLIEDPRLLSQLLPFIDKENFLADIQEIRKKRLKMNGLYDREFVEELYKYHYGYSLRFIKRDGFLQAIKRLSEKFKNVSDIPLSIDMPISYAIRETSALLRKYHKNTGYLRAVVYAILCGKIKDGDYTQNTYSLLITPEIIKGVLFEPPFSYVTIVINPESTVNEVVDVFKRTYQTFFYKSSWPVMVRKKDTFRSASPDTSSRIKDFREWYWLNHKSNPNRIGYRKIAKETGVKMETVISGIKAYTTLLKTSR